MPQAYNELRQAMIRAGRMRSTVTIERPGTPGGLGQTVWETFETARGELRTPTGRETFGPQTLGSEVSHVFVTRHQAGITANMRLVLQGSGRIFHITHIIPDMEGNARFLNIFCKEVITA